MTAPLGVAARLRLQRALRASGPGRRLLALLATAYVAARRRRRCRIEHVDGHWVHTWSTGVVVDLLLTSRPPEEWDEDTRRVALHGYTPLPGDFAVDVGAGVGHETRLLSRLVGPHGRVVAVEANPRVFACLTEMVHRNGLANVTCLQVAAATGPGVVRLADDEDHLGNAATADSGVVVDAAAVDDLLDDLGLDHVDFVKMNIEGAEVAALRGMPGALTTARAVTISCHDFLAEAGGPESLRTKDEVRAILERTGFELHTRDDVHPWLADYVYGTRY